MCNSYTTLIVFYDLHFSNGTFVDERLRSLRSVYKPYTTDINWRLGAYAKCYCFQIHTQGRGFTGQLIITACSEFLLWKIWQSRSSWMRPLNLIILYKKQKKTTKIEALFVYIRSTFISCSMNILTRLYWQFFFRLLWWCKNNTRYHGYY